MTPELTDQMMSFLAELIGEDDQRRGSAVGVSAVLGLIGLGMRAGHLVVGVDAVRSALQAGKVPVRGGGERCHAAHEREGGAARRRRKACRWCRARTPMLLGERLGRPPVMVVGVRDRALAAGVQGAAAARQ